MTTISILSRLINGVQRNVDLSGSGNILAVYELDATSQIKIGATALTQVILDSLIAHDHAPQSDNQNVTAGDGLTGGGSGATPTLAVGQGDGISVTADAVAVDSTVMRKNASNTMSSGSNITFAGGGEPLGLPATPSVDGAAASKKYVNDQDALKLNLAGGSMTGAIAMGSNKITGLANGTDSGDAVNKSQLDLKADLTVVVRKDQNTTLGADVVIKTNYSSHVPTDATELINKAYADAIAAGFDAHQAVHLATTAALDVTAAGSKVGKTLTANSNGAISIDGHAGNLGDRILVKNQVAAVDNGVYTITVAGDGSTPFQLTRATDMDGSPASEVASGDQVFVTEGVNNGGTSWAVFGSGIVDVDVDDFNWTQVAGIADIQAGNGLTKTGNVLDVNVDNTTIELSTDALRIKAGGISNSHIAANAAIDFSKLATLADGKILVGSAGGVATAVTMTGDITILNTGATAIGSGKVTNDMLAGSIVDSKLSQITTANKVAGSAVQLKASGGLKDSTGLAVEPADIAGNGLEDNGSDKLQVKLAPNSGLTVSASGLALAGGSTKVFVAGEAFAANTAFAVRLGLSTETANRVYKADKSAVSGQPEKFHVIGIAWSTASVAAGDNIEVISSGELVLASAVYNASDVGKPFFLSSTGALTVTAPGTVDDAVVACGIVKDTDKIWIMPMQLRGIN